MLNRTEYSFKGCPSLLMQHSQSKVADFYWEAGLTLNCIGVIFILSLYTVIYFQLICIMRKYMAWKLSPCLGIGIKCYLYLKIQYDWLRNLETILVLQCSTKKKFASVPVLLTHIQEQLHVKSHSPVLHFCFYFVIAMIVQRMIFFPASGINTALLPKAIA